MGAKIRPKISFIRSIFARMNMPSSIRLDRETRFSDWPIELGVAVSCFRLAGC